MTQQPADESAEDKQAAAELLPVLYEELRRLAASLTTGLPAGQTLQPTALVHEAYLRLVKNKDPGWEGRRHFFGAAARAMREILIEQARKKASFKHGGNARRIELTEGVGWIEPPSGELWRWMRQSRSSTRKTPGSARSFSFGITPGSPSKKPPASSAIR